MKDTAVIIFEAVKKGILTDIDVPLNISAYDFIVGMNKAYALGIDIENVFGCYLKSENPIALLKGNKSLADYGVHNGTTIIYTE